MNEKAGRTIVMVLHDLNLASGNANYMIAIKDKKVFAQGKPEDVITSELVITCIPDEMQCLLHVTQCSVRQCAFRMVRVAVWFGKWERKQLYRDLKRKEKGPGRLAWGLSLC